MATTTPRSTPRRPQVTRRDFLKRTGWATAGATALMVGAGRGRPAAQTAAPYPDWIPASPKPPKRGGVLTRASAWDPPVIDPRLTQSVGLFQFVGLTSNRLLRYAFTDEATGSNDLSLKGDLAESWSASPDQRVWTFKLRRGVKWQNVPPVKGRELVAADVKYCFEAYANEGVQAFTFQEIEGMETPDTHTLRVHLKTPNTLFAQNVAEPVTVIFPREVLEEDGDLKKRMIGTGPYILKEHTRKVRLVLQRNPDYFDTGRPYVDEYVILSAPDAATRLAAFRTGASDMTCGGRGVRGRGGAQDEPRHRRAGAQEHAGAVRPGAGPGPAPVQRRAGAARHLDRDRPPEAGGHGVRGPRDPGLGRAVSLLPGHAADGEGPRAVVAVSSGGGEEAAGGGRPSQRLRDDAVLLRVLPADDLAGAAGPAGPQEEPEHQREDHQARLHELLRPVRRGQMGRDGLGLPVGPRGRARRADVHVHAFEVHEELLPRQRPASSTS